ncbi:hypothetical protein [Synechococcus elongatus]|uniref:hypothetical protein n=1 Tax=Synechococcus elongatus TaxID=32046 RepID=UPI000F7E8CB7|nr:hypothetical protein [Synechococcus elongatus]
MTSHPYETPYVAWTHFVFWAQSEGRKIVQDPSTRRILNPNLHRQWQAWKTAWLWSKPQQTDPMPLWDREEEEVKKRLDLPLAIAKEPVIDPWMPEPDGVHTPESQKAYDEQFRR